jgi:hypothetical protein
MLDVTLLREEGAFEELLTGDGLVGLFDKF